MVTQASPTIDAARVDVARAGRPLHWIWSVVSLVTFAVAISTAYEVGFGDVGSSVRTVVPFVVLAAMTFAFTQPLSPDIRVATLVAAVVSIAGWSVLVLHDERWSILTFALYAMSMPIGRMVGLALGGAVTLIWTIAMFDEDGSNWQLFIPTVAFGVGAILAVSLRRAGEENVMLTDLVNQLHETRRDLAASERENGALAERARFAGEIHDTLAQGFTSIVLLTRAARVGEHAEHLDQIESTAEESLQAARRLVAAIGPAELEAASLPDALKRHVDAALDPEVDARFEVAGTPAPLHSSIEVALLRGLQEALLNVRTHANASNVFVTLTYLGDVVALDVRDDGAGFTVGETSDRGSLTGGQGLGSLRRRAESLGGELDVESDPAGGTVLSLQLPAVRA